MADQRDQELPPTLALIASEVGEEVALKLARAFGGRRAYFPRHPAPDHGIAKALGLDDAKRVGAVIGHGWVHIPLGPTSRAAQLSRSIRHALAEGESTKAIVQRLGCSERTVRNHRALMREEGSLPDAQSEAR